MSSLFGNLFGATTTSDCDSRLFNPVYKKDAPGVDTSTNQQDVVQPNDATKKPKKTSKSSHKTERVTEGPDPASKGKELDDEVKPKSKKRKHEPEVKMSQEKNLESATKEKKKKRKRDADAVQIEPEEEETVKPPKPEKKVAPVPRERLSAEEEAEKLSRTIFIGNLAAATSLKTLKKLFSQYGEVESGRMRSVAVASGEGAKGTRRSKVLRGELNQEEDHCHVYLVFKHLDGATAALAHNMKEVGGRHLRVDRAAPASSSSSDAAAAGGGGDSKRGGGREVEYDRQRTVFIGNLAFATTEEDVIRHFQGTEASSLYPELKASIEAVRLVRDRETNKSKGVGFVLFKTKEAQRAALNLHKDTLNDREIRVTRVSSKPTGGKPSKGNRSNSQSSGNSRSPSQKSGSKFNKKGVKVASPKTSSGGASWQGQSTKKKPSLEKGSKSLGANTPRGNPTPRPNGGKKDGGSDKKRKRPSVEARKTAQLKKKK